MEVNKVMNKQEIWDEEEAKKLAPQRFHKWIHVFGKKASERMPMKKL